MLAKGINPGAEKKQAREAVLAKEREERDTFEFVAREWFAKYEPTLSEKHAKKLRRYLENTLFPAIGGKPASPGLNLPTSYRLSNPQNGSAITKQPTSSCACADR